MPAYEQAFSIAGEYGSMVDVPELAVFALAAAFVAVLATCSRRDLLALAGAVALGSALRLLFSPPTLFGMSNYEREPVLLDWSSRLVSAFHFLPDGLDRFEAILLLNLIVSCALPLVFFLWADVAFQKRRVSLLVAGLAAICPLHVLFASSDVMYVTSNLFAACLFLLLASALRARRLGWELVFGLGALSLLSPMLLARQINFLYGPLAMLLALEMVLRGGGFAAWRKAMWGTLVMAASLAHFAVLAAALTEMRGSDLPTIIGEDSAGTRRLVTFLFTNNFLRPEIYPFPLTLLAMAGFVVLWRRHRWHLAFIAGFVLLFHGGHTVVPAWNSTAAARYGLQSIVPILFAAAFGADALIDAWRRFSPARAWMRPAACGAALAVSVVGLVPGTSLFGRPPSDLQEEYGFLRELARGGIPEEGALVVESYDAGSAPVSPSPRFAYFGRRVRGGELVETVVSSTEVVEHAGPVYFFLGLPCFWNGEKGEMSGACARMLEAHPWKVVAARAVKGARHDNANGEDARGARITLYRLAREETPPVSEAGAAGG